MATKNDRRARQRGGSGGGSRADVLRGEAVARPPAGKPSASQNVNRGVTESLAELLSPILLEWLKLHPWRFSHVAPLECSETERQ
jgi:hypothetical protein